MSVGDLCEPEKVVFCTHDQGLSVHAPDRVNLLASVLLSTVTKVEKVDPPETVGMAIWIKFLSNVEQAGFP